jgi:YhcH/YjgK/YiaL family protein
MRKQAGYLLLLLVVCLFAISVPLFPQSPAAGWNKKSANTWVKKKEWKNGLKLNPHSSTNIPEFARQYHLNQAKWEKAFAYLRDNDLEKLPLGKYAIDGENVFASVTEAPSKEFDKTGWESHRKYIDLQYVIRGQEKIGVASAGAASILKPYDENTDVQNYTTEGKYYIAKPGTFFLFFADDAHRPVIKVNGYHTVKKIVIKIRTAE